jgi:hypothetical protein
MEEAASDPLHGSSVIPVLHVRAGRPDEESEVREVPATLWNTAACMLEGVGEWQVGSGRNGISRDNEPDKEPHGWRRRLSRKLQTAGLGPRKKNRRMEVLVEEGWIWWNAEKNQAATGSGRVTTVLRDGKATLENGLWVWKPGDDGPILARVGGANLPVDGGGTASSN